MLSRSSENITKEKVVHVDMSIYSIIASRTSTAATSLDNRSASGSREGSGGNTCRMDSFEHKQNTLVDQLLTVSLFMVPSGKMLNKLRLHSKHHESLHWE